MAGTGIYYSIYELLLQHIYGVEAAVLTSDQTLTLTFLATCACVLMVALPFVIVWRVIRISF